MIPNFNPKKWDREKIIDWVIGDEPLTDQQLEFLLYFESLQEENKELKAEIRECNDSIVWWENRFNAVNHQNARLKAKLDKAERGDKHEEIHQTLGNNI